MRDLYYEGGIPTHPTSFLKTSLIRLLIVLSLASISLVFLAAFVLMSSPNRYEKATFDGMINGTAYKPFVTRVLISWVTIGTKTIIPVDARSSITQFARTNPFVSFVVLAYGIPQGYELDGIINIFWQYLSLLGFVLIFMLLIRKVFDLSLRTWFFLMFIALFGLLPFFKYSYIYDLPELFLCTLAYYAIVSKRMSLYFLVYVCAVLNKETSILLIIPSILFFSGFQSHRRSKIICVLMAQIFLFLIIRGVLYYIFRNNPGVNLEIHFMDHLLVFVNQPIHGFLGVIGSIIIGLLLFYKWKQKPAIIGLGFCSGIILFVLFLIGGYPFEFRVFYEVYAVLILSVAWSYLNLRKYTLGTHLISTEQLLHSCPFSIIRNVT